MVITLPVRSVERDVVALAGDAEFEAVVHEAFAVQSIGEAELGHQLDRALFEQAGAHAFDDILPAAVLQHDRFDTGAAQEVRQQQSRGSRTDDFNLGSHDVLWN